MYFNISETKLSITSLYIISDAPKYDIIWTENSDVIEIFISDILKYESSVIEFLTENPRPYYSHISRFIRGSSDVGLLV